jgi:hypothetical protein
MLTLKKLKKMRPHEIIDRGETVDSPKGVNMTNSGAQLRWIAIRGGINDWAIYIHHAWQDWEFILDEGDKVCQKENIKKLVPCSRAAFEMYRY